MIGIYKIISPSNRIYIGQSLDIENRFSDYRKLKCKAQPRIYSSLIKYGFDLHILEVIEECEVDSLNERERYWQEYYNCIGKNGLNCQLVSTNELKKVHSEETKNKISIGLTGLKHTEESKIKISKGLIGRKVSVETRKKISESNKGTIFSEERKKNISNSLTGRKLSKECLDKRSKTISGENNYKAKIVLNTQSGIYYGCIGDAAIAHNIHRNTLNNYLTGFRKNKTNLVYA